MSVNGEHSSGTVGLLRPGQPADEMTMPLFVALMGGLLGAFQFGYNTAVLNSPEKYIKADLHLSKTIEWSLAVSIFAIGGLMGALLAGRIADRFGRKLFLVANAAPFALAGVLMAFARNKWQLVAARFIVGVACGGATVVVPMYLGEIAPKRLRGAFGTLNQFGVVIGILVASVFGFPLEDHHGWWRWMVGFLCVPSVLQLVLAPFMPRSPRWLAHHGHVDEARAVLVTLRCRSNVEEELDEIQTGGVVSEEEEAEETGVRKVVVLQDDEDAQSEGGPTLSSFFSNPVLRYAFLSAVTLQLCQQLSGINAVFYYSTSFFEKAGFSKPIIGTVLAAAVNAAATGVAVPLMDMAGRRPLLLIGAGGMIVSALALTLVQSVNPFTGAQALTVVMVLAFVTFFEVGLGPIPWLIGGELFTNKHRAFAMSLLATINWLCNFTVGLLFPIMNDAMNTYVFLPFAGILAIGFALAYVYVPETKGRTPEQVLEGIRRRQMGA